MVAWKRALEAGQRPENQVEDPKGEWDETSALFTSEMVAWKGALEAGQRPENQVEDPEGDGDETSSFLLRNGGREEGTGSRSETRKPGGRPRRRRG